VGEFDLGRCSGISTSGLYWGVFGIDLIMSPGSIRPYTSDPSITPGSGSTIKYV